MGMNKKVLGLAIVAGMLCHTSVFAAIPDGALFKTDANTDAGAQMNQLQDYFQKERIASELEENKNKEQAKIEQEKQDSSQEGSISFHLEKLQVQDSAVLSKDELSAITSKYEGREISIKDLNNAIEEINKLYEDKGYIGCRAFLEAQKIENGTVTISLLETNTGNTVVTDNESTDSQYVLERVPLKKGEIASLNKLNKDIIRFNATNDAQLKVVLKAGEEENTTDYYIQVKEPQQRTVSTFVDNMGSKSTGEYRWGLFYTNRSLSDRRDALTLGGVLTEGTKAFSAMYNYPLGRSGTKLNLSYSANDVEQIKNTQRQKVTGDAHSYSVGITQPWIVTPRYRNELSLTYNHQVSKSNLEIYSADTTFNIVDDTIQDWTLAYSSTDYGKSGIFYQRHSIIRGNSNSAPTPLLSRNKPLDYTIYKLSTIYQKAYQAGQMLSFRLDGQYSFKDNLVSSRRFYMGGMYSVRGYQESFLSADGGINASLEYSVPLTKDRQLASYLFLDYGRTLGENSDGNETDEYIVGTGIGFRATINKNISCNLVFGFPLKKDFPGKGETVDNMRVNFMVSGRF